MDSVGLKALLLVICSLVVSINCQTDNETEPIPLNGKTLFDIGVKIENPTLRLIGKTLQQLECQYHFCSAWSEWSDCELMADQFGRQTRTRPCGINDSCGSSQSPRDETESKLCQDSCPDDYEMSPEGFCVKFYKTYLSWPGAYASCETNGAHLININSPMKWKSFVFLMEKYEYVDGVYIDGTRADVSSPWGFGYETDIAGYTNWGTGQPTNGGTALCLYAIKTLISGGIGDYTCSTTRYYVCEKLPSIQ